jgi:hypothetical protein
MRETGRSPVYPDFGVGPLSVDAPSRAYALASSLTSELLAHTLRPNVLVIGPVARSEATVAAIVGALSALSMLSTPVQYWTPDSPLPSPGDTTTIVIRDIATLSLSSQQAWLARMNDPHAHAQIIATSSIAVFPLVARGVFLEDLYYRLNTVLLDVLKSDPAE